MADVILAAATSHTPMVCMRPEDWAEYALGDRHNTGLLDVDGQPRSFDELAAAQGDRLLPELGIDRFRQRAQTSQESLDRLAETFARMAPDVAVIVGDDQDELFGPDGQPSMAIYWGDTLEMGPREGLKAVLVGREADSSRRWQQDVAAGQAIDEPHAFPVAAELARDLLGGLVGQGFDIASMRATPSARKFGHAFGFVIRRLLGDGRIPVVPLLINTFYAPNQPSPARCYALGKALRKVVEEHSSGARVAVVASGGLSHFMVDEELDRQVLAAIQGKDGQALCDLPPGRLNSGTSEVRNWITVAGAAEHLPVAWSAYEPAYRTPAGTGCGLAFVQWA